MNFQSKIVMIFGEVRTNGRIHPATFELTAKGRELGEALSDNSRVSVILTCGKLEDDAHRRRDVSDEETGQPDAVGDADRGAGEAEHDGFEQ